MTEAPKVFAKAGTSDQFAQIEQARDLVGPVILPGATHDAVCGRYLMFVSSLQGWRLACQRLDRDQTELLASLARFRTSEAKVDDAFISLAHGVIFDIRCFYIFAKIGFVAFASIVCAMASDSKSRKWQSAANFVKALKNENARTIQRVLSAFRQRLGMVRCSR
jgi:hypothetical protein